MDAATPIDTRDLPALQAALWDRHDTIMTAEDVFHLYEDRWRYIDQAEMDANEKALFERLVVDIGKGVFLGR